MSPRQAWQLLQECFGHLIAGQFTHLCKELNALRLEDGEDPFVWLRYRKNCGGPRPHGETMNESTIHSLSLGAVPEIQKIEIHVLEGSISYSRNVLKQRT